MSMRRVAALTLVILLLVGLALAAWRLASLLLLAFGGILLAVVLERLAAALARWLPLGRRVALAVVVLLLAGALVAFGWLFGHQIGGQAQDLRDALASGLEQARTWARGTGLPLPRADGLMDGDVISRALSAATQVMNVLAGMLIVLFIALYTAINPALCLRGVVLLAPRRHEERVRAVLSAVGEALWRWMLGQAVSMATIFVLVTATLTLLGVPMALVLGLIAGLAEFVPILGPWAAAVPAVLVGLSVSPQMALWVAVAYVAIQQVESYVIAPLAERWAVALPPALTVATTTAFALLFGVVGILFATPVTVAAMVVVRMVYVRDTLGHTPDTRKMPG